MARKWSIDVPAAVAEQRRLADRVARASAGPIDQRLWGGADVSHHGPSNRLYAGVVVLDGPNGAVIAQAGAVQEAEFPYVPGLLSFRELPVLLKAYARLTVTPTLLLVDGNGLAHPRRFGLACHLGVTIDLLTIGVAKQRLVGQHRVPADRRRSGCQLVHRGEIVGRVVRTKTNVAPVFVSIGHRIGLEEAVRCVLRATPTHRLPTPIREAHRFVNQLRRESEKDHASPSYVPE